jgi:hypothetical protein
MLDDYDEDYYNYLEEQEVWKEEYGEMSLNTGRWRENYDKLF